MCILFLCTCWFLLPRRAAFVKFGDKDCSAFDILIRFATRFTASPLGWTTLMDFLR